MSAKILDSPKMFNPCCMKTVSGKPCLDLAKGELPCCVNHIAHWVIQENKLLWFIRMYSHQIRDIYSLSHDSQLAGVLKPRSSKEFRLLVAGFSNHNSMIQLRVTLEEAEVITDLLLDLGHPEISSRIRQKISMISSTYLIIDRL